MTCSASISSSIDVRRFLRKSLSLGPKRQESPGPGGEPREDAGGFAAARPDAPHTRKE